MIATSATFAPLGIAELQGGTLVIFQVIWAIGASMVVLSGLQFLGRPVCLALGAVILVGHNLLDPIWPVSPNLLEPNQPLWVGLHAQMSFVVGPFFVLVAYPVLPWIGVMLLRFRTASGVFELAPDERRERQLAVVGRRAAGGRSFVHAAREPAWYGDPEPVDGAGRGRGADDRDRLS